MTIAAQTFIKAGHAIDAAIVQVDQIDTSWLAILAVVLPREAHCKQSTAFGCPSLTGPPIV
jgi:hypothetical protein